MWMIWKGSPTFGKFRVEMTDDHSPQSTFYVKIYASGCQSITSGNCILHYMARAHIINMVFHNSHLLVAPRHDSAYWALLARIVFMKLHAAGAGIRKDSR